MKTTIHTTQHERLTGKRYATLVIEPLVCVAPDTPVSYALTLMRSKSAACLAVTYNRKPVGTFSERNLNPCHALSPRSGQADHGRSHEFSCGRSARQHAVVRCVCVDDPPVRLQLLAVVDHNGELRGALHRGRVS